MSKLTRFSVSVPDKLLQQFDKKIDEDNYEVFLELFENKKRIMKISLNVINRKQADQIIAKWEKESEFLYGDIIQLFTKETPNKR